MLSRLDGVEPDPLICTFSTFLAGTVEGICLQYALMDKVEADEEFMGRLLMFLFSINYEKVVEYIRNNPRLDFM